jgi:transcriptional regulator of aromatic amino acid metabolism
VKTSIAKEHIRSALGIRARISGSTKPESGRFHIITSDRIGLLKDITTVLANAKINISSLESPPLAASTQLPVTIIGCAHVDKPKLEKILIRLRKIRGVKEVNYKSS